MTGPSEQSYGDDRHIRVKLQQRGSEKATSGSDPSECPVPLALAFGRPLHFLDISGKLFWPAWHKQISTLAVIDKRPRTNGDQLPTPSTWPGGLEWPWGRTRRLGTAFISVFGLDGKAACENRKFQHPSLVLTCPVSAKCNCCFWRAPKIALSIADGSWGRGKPGKRLSPV